MTIELATKQDMKRICCSLRNKKIDYITPALAISDIDNSRLYIIKDKDKIIAQCALVEEKEYGYYAIKRLVVYNKKNCGKGIAQQFISFFCEKNLPALGCTPWDTNIAMKKLLERNGFVYQYTFMERYEFYKKA